MQNSFVKNEIFLISASIWHNLLQTLHHLKLKVTKLEEAL